MSWTLFTSKQGDLIIKITWQPNLDDKNHCQRAYSVSQSPSKGSIRVWLLVVFGNFSALKQTKIVYHGTCLNYPTETKSIFLHSNCTRAKMLEDSTTFLKLVECYVGCTIAIKPYVHFSNGCVEGIKCSHFNGC